VSELKIDVITVGMLEVNCLLIYDSEVGRGIIVDPGEEGDRIAAAVDDRKFVPECVVLTHGHGDHIAAVDDVRDRFGIPVAIGRDDAAMLENASFNLSAGFGVPLEMRPAERLLSEGDDIQAGGHVLKVLDTPGHTRGSITLSYRGHAAVGDLVFAGSVGRTDLSGGSFQTLLSSIQEKILTMPDDTILYPGHGPVTTVGAERRSNPFLTGVY